MLRRDFITNVILGVCCTSELLARPFDKQHALPQKYFNEFVASINAHALNASDVSDQNLLNRLAAESASYIKTGYQKMGSQIHFCREMKTAFIPLVLQTPETGILDVQVIFTEKSEKTEWQRSGVLSGFHLEAISEYMSANFYSSKQLTETLVPILKKERNIQYPQALATGNGYMHLHVTIQEGRATSRLQLLSNSHQLLAKHDIRSASKLS